MATCLVGRRRHVIDKKKVVVGQLLNPPDTLDQQQYTVKQEDQA
jgi:hypothetical protein